MQDFEKVSDEEFNFVKGKMPTGTGYNFNRAYRNNEYAVLVRTVDTKWGKIRHAAIRNIKSTDISWKEKQEIKDKIFGKNKTGIEVYPKEKDLVDDANMYHLWILPKEMELPFTL